MQGAEEFLVERHTVHKPSVACSCGDFLRTLIWDVLKPSTLCC